MVITSKNNTIISNLMDETRKNILTCLDTPKLVYEAISCGITPKYILVEDGKDFLLGEGLNVVSVSNSLINSISSVKTNAGILAFVEMEKKKPLKPPQKFLVLDSLQDPGNVGTLIRSALGADFKDIFLIDCAKLSNEKAIRSSMGAVFKTNCFELKKDEFVCLANSWKLNLVCADMDGDNLFDCQFDKDVGIVLGNEGNGVSKELEELCKRRISIPMKNGLESLNVAVSGAIIMYQISNRIKGK